MKYIKQSAYIVSKACFDNPVLSVILVAIFYLAFSSIEAIIEELVFGKPFLHWLDPLFAIAFMAYAALCVWICAQIQISKDGI